MIILCVFNRKCLFSNVTLTVTNGDYKENTLRKKIKMLVTLCNKCIKTDLYLSCALLIYNRNVFPPLFFFSKHKTL